MVDANFIDRLVFELLTQCFLANLTLLLVRTTVAVTSKQGTDVIALGCRSFFRLVFSKTFLFVLSCRTIERAWTCAFKINHVSIVYAGIKLSNFCKSFEGEALEIDMQKLTIKLH